MDATLSGAGPFTVFAPNDQAFENLAAALGFASAKDMISGEGAVSPDLLATILTYHVVGSAASAASLSDAQEVTTVQGESFTVNITDGGIFLQDKTEREETSSEAQVVETDVIVTNGIIHTIDKVLLPQAVIDAAMIDTRPTITELAVANDGLTILEAAVIKAGFADLLSSKNVDEDGNELGYTVFAPSDDAFVALLDFLGDDYNSLDDFDNGPEMQLLSDILAYHVVPQRVESSAVVVGEVATALEDASLEITAASETAVAITDAVGGVSNSIALDVQGSNGVIHVIDRVLLPETAQAFLDKLAADDLADIVVAEPTLSILEAALIKTELVSVFVDDSNTGLAEGDEAPSNFTYFQTATVLAPTDDAFVALLDLLGDDYNSLDDFDTEEEIALLTNILLYHVVSGSVTSESVVAGTVINTQIADTIEVIDELGSDSVLLQDTSGNSDAQLLALDVMARNGVAHIIDTVLLPQEAIDFINSLNEVVEEPTE
ncbi:fasciclin domain-containing protein [Maribacter sp. 2-571]|uniref:fasciclin domain-containing protein n=1 Tax=Maribacter sp. 2-571 TaxID=3417569 RepID=UPI003D349B75